MRLRNSALALAAVSAAAAAGYARLFADAGWILPVAAAVAGAHGVAAATRRWAAVRAAAAHLGALGLLLAWSAGGHTAGGFPTPASVSGLLEVAAHAVDAFRAGIVPVPSTPELLAWAVAGIWVCAALADGLLRRHTAGLTSVIPLVVVHAVVATLGTSRWRPLTAFAFAGAVGLFAVVERTERFPRGWAVTRPGRPCRPVLASAGLALSVAAAALVLGPVVPGGASPPILDVHALGVQLDVSRVELNPLVDLRPQLTRTEPRELFTVRSSRPAYWRLTALDRFDGRLWSPSRPAPRPAEGGSHDTGSAGTAPALRQQFRISALDSPWLPAAHQVLRVEESSVRLDPTTDALVTRRGSQEVGTYRVDSRLPPAEAAATPPTPAAGAAQEAVPTLEHYLELPGDFPEPVRTLAKQFVGGLSTPYERALALQDHLRVRYAYSEAARPGHSNDDLLHFLFETRHGYCEQFAGAYAAMARALDLPARVAVGFTPGTYDPDAGVWRVTTREAHAWPEVYLEGRGWVAFEPTPGRYRPSAETETRPPAGPSPAGTRPGALLSGLDRSSPGPEELLLDAAAGRDAGPPKGDLPAPDGIPGPLALVLGGAALTVALPPMAKGLRRRGRQGGGSRHQVAAAWQEALDRLSEAGLAPGKAETPLEFAGRAERVRPGTGAALVPLATLLNGSVYAAHPPGAASAAAAWSAIGRLTRALDAGDPAWARCRRRLDPRPLLPARRP